MNMKLLSRALAGIAATGLVLAGCATGADRAPTGSTGSPSPTSAAEREHNDADVQFAQAMIPHHQQAVEMAELAAERSENQQVLDLSVRISAAQDPEIATMSGWLQEWGVPAPTEAGSDDMAGMDHGEQGGMGGMMTPEQMSALAQVSGVAFDRMFLEMMIDHHRGAVEMSQLEVDSGADPEAIALAQRIISAQQGEITEMETLLQQL